jgi:outer membrane protein TolC
MNAQMDEMQSSDCTLVSICELASHVNPGITAQQFSVDRTEYAIDVLNSDFDPLFYASANANRSGVNLNSLDPRVDLIGNMLNTNQYALSGGVQKRMMNGMTVNSSLEFNRISDNIPINVYNENVGGHIGDNATALNLSIVQPLLRGKGKKYNTAPIEIAKIDAKTEQSGLTFTTSEQIQNVVLAYWQYYSDYERLKIYKTNERRVRSVLEMTTELVNANRQPASDLLQIQADLLDKERQVIAAKQNVYAARQNLGRFIGLSEEDSHRIGKPIDIFPEVVLDEAVSAQKLIEIAHTNRMDLDILDKQKSRSEILLDLAKNDLQPNLNLTGTARYGGTDFGNGLHRIVTPLATDDGRNYTIGIGLSYDIPIGNKRAESTVLINQTSVSNQELLYDNQKRNIEINVSIEHNNLVNSVDAVNKSRQTLEYYEEVFDNEQLKFQNGLSTILNLILFQERLTFAQLEYIFNQQQMASAIVRLRHQTGTLVESTYNALTIQNKHVFYQLPIIK